MLKLLQIVGTDFLLAYKNMTEFIAQISEKNYPKKSAEIVR
jgi:hypothetical protein